MRTSTRGSSETEVQGEATADRGSGQPTFVEGVLRLQRSAGNSAVARLLMRDETAVTESAEQQGGDNEAARKLFMKGAAEYEKGQFGHAYDSFTQAYEIAPRSGLVFSRAQALRKLGGRRDDAIPLYEDYLSMPDITRQKDAEAALAELRGPGKTGDEAIDSPEAKKLFMKGAAEYEKGQFGHAYDSFTQAYEIAPRSGLVFSRAQALRKLGGRRDDAIPLYEDYLSMPDITRQKDAEAALAELRGPGKTGDEAIDSPEAKKLFMKGAAEYEKGQFGHAYDSFTQAYEIAPRSGLVFSRAQALRKLGGRRDDAIALYEDYLSMPDITRQKDAEAALAELQPSGAAP